MKQKVLNEIKRKKRCIFCCKQVSDIQNEKYGSRN